MSLTATRLLPLQTTVPRLSCIIYHSCTAVWPFQLFRNVAPTVLLAGVASISSTPTMSLRRVQAMAPEVLEALQRVQEAVVEAEQTLEKLESLPSAREPTQARAAVNWATVTLREGQSF